MLEPRGAQGGHFWGNIRATHFSQLTSISLLVYFA